ncbi:MAG: hypothetical protein HQ559_04120, partial [Lentisphaerae bacterium]|nr:hypothetical protein [Lentisphaerota bacterium]
LLDGLVRLARDGSYPDPRGLNVVALEWADITEVDKGDPFRLRYGEIADADWGDVEEGFFTYAAKDVLATFHACNELVTRAFGVAAALGETILAYPVVPHGLLTERIQIKGAIGLAEIERYGVGVDTTRLAHVRTRLLREIDSLVADIRGLPDASGIFKTNGAGDVARTSSGWPSMNNGRLREILGNVLRRVDGPPVSHTPTGKLTTAEDAWTPYEAKSPFVHKWLELRRRAKILQFTKPPAAGRVYPHYTVLKRTGRTSCSNPNFQQIPREGGIRECFIPSPGFYFLSIDYSFVELVTLAAVCLDRYGRSTLADVIEAGRDPHCYTASVVNGMPYESFVALATSDHAKYKADRQKAKALNFGLPAGLGVAALVLYARVNYGVDLSESDAAALRRTLIHDVYPELEAYLSDDEMETLAFNLGCSPKRLWPALWADGSRPGWLPSTVKRIVSGNCIKRDGSLYSRAFVDRIWCGLAQCCHRHDILGGLVTQQGTPELAERLFRRTVTTLTGRVRAGVSYTQARNTPFQGLAADGAKLACYRLVRAGYHVAAFVHDEFLIELPADANHTAEAERIKALLCDAMSDVLRGSVPVKAEYVLCDRWSKDAKCLIDDSGELRLWEAPSVPEDEGREESGTVPQEQEEN